MNKIVYITHHNGGLDLDAVRNPLQAFPTQYSYHSMIDSKSKV